MQATEPSLLFFAFRHLSPSIPIPGAHPVIFAAGTYILCSCTRVILVAFSRLNGLNCEHDRPV